VTINGVEGAYTVLPRTYMELTTMSRSGRDNYEQNVNSDVRENAHMEHSLPSSEFILLKQDITNLLIKRHQT
jgi:hypothetical protein